MNVLYKAKTQISRRYYTESYWHLRFYRRSAVVVFVIQILIVLYVMYGAIESTYTTFKFYDGRVTPVLVLLWIAAPVLLCSILFAAQISAARKLRRNAKEFGTAERFGETCFYEDHFTVYSSTRGIETSVPYASIIKVEQTKHYYIMILKGNQANVVEKAGFEDQKAAEAYRFLCSKIAHKN